MIQRTFVMIKPDGVERGLVGEVLSTFERAGLRLKRLELCRPTRRIAEEQYPQDDDWLSTAGKKGLSGLVEAGMDPLKELGTNVPMEIGHIIHERLVDFLCSGDVVIMIIEGNLAVSNVRRLIGSTIPCQADPSTIRGRYCIDSADLSFLERRPVLNIVHASGNVDEAEREIELWFGSKDTV